MKWTVIVFGGLIGLVLVAGAALYPSGVKKLSQTYADIPVETVTIPSDPEAVARGKHVAIIWGCTKCHGEDLSGSLLTNDAILGKIPAANLTAGKGGIGGSYSDTDWVRAIRHGVKPDGRGEAFMNNYSTLSDRDLGELIAGLSLCERVVCSDGGAMHLAAALGKPIVCLFGRSDAARWHPFGVRYELLQPASLEVRDISVSSVAAALERLG